MHRFAAWLLASAIAITIPAEVRAQDITLAQAGQFAKAQALYDARDFAAALPLFEELLAQTKSPNARLYVARTLRDLGRLPEAFDAMSLTVREAGARAESERKYEQTRDSAAAELALLQEKVAHIVIAIADPPAEAKTLLDGVPVSSEALRNPITVTPGSHRIEVSGGGVEPVVRELELKGGQTKTEAIALKKLDEPDEKPPPITQSRGGGELRIVGIAAAGVGVAGLATFVATALLASDRFATLEDECGSARCTEAKYADVVDEGKTFELVSTVTLVVGAVFAAGSVPLIIFGGPSETSATAGLAPVPGGGVVSLRGRF
jgi:tetratricopeptide (TPR) repeat protein